MAIDASDILSAWMAGSRFVSENLKDAEERRQKEEDQRMQGLGVKYRAMTSPRFVNGQLVPPDWGAVFNDPDIQTVINDNAGDLLNRGLPEGVNFKMQGASVVPDKDGNPTQLVVKGRQFDADGNPLSDPDMPITQGRSSDPRDPVVTLSFDYANNAFLQALGKRHPDMATAIIKDQHDQAYNAALVAIRNEQDPQKRGFLVNQTAQYFGVPPVHINQEANAVQTTEDPVNGVLHVYNPDRQTKVVVPNKGAADTGNYSSGLKDQREIKRIQAVSPVSADVEAGNALRNAGKTADAQIIIAEKTIPATTKAQAQAGLSAAPTVGKAEGTRQVAADNVTRPHEQSTTLSENTGEYQALHDAVTKPSMENDRKLLQFYKPEQIANAKAQFRTDTLAPQMFKNSDAVQAVTDTTGIYASTPDPTARKRLRGMAVNALSSSDPVEQAKGWETLQRFDLVDKGLDAFGSKGAGEKVKMPKFYPDEVKHFALATDELTDQQKGEAGIEMRRTFDSTLKTLAEAGVPAATLKATEGDLGKATALDYRLRSTEGVSNTAPTLYVAMQMAKKHDAKGLTEEDLALRVVGPLKKMLDEQGVSGSRVLFEAIEDTYRLRGAGVGLDRAVDEAAKMTDPKYTQGLLVTLGKKYPKEIAAAKDAANRGQKGAVLETIATLRARSIKEEPGLNQRGGELVKQYFPAWAKTVEDMYGWGNKGLRAAEGGARAARIIPGGESPGGLMVNRPNPVVDAINR